jgi:hypothetical protein
MKELRFSISFFLAVFVNLLQIARILRCFYENFY